jgi:hypothetical protein
MRCRGVGTPTPHFRGNRRRTAAQAKSMACRQPPHRYDNRRIDRRTNRRTSKINGLQHTAAATIFARGGVQIPPQRPVEPLLRRCFASVRRVSREGEPAPFVPGSAVIRQHDPAAG